MAKKKKFYVVWAGNDTGIFDSWADCQASIKGFAGARYKSFSTKAAAEQAFEEGSSEHWGKGTSAKSTLTDEQKKLLGVPNWESIAVDAACSGNPGLLEYQGVDTTTGRQLFHQGPFPEGTQNIGEFLAIVHALAMLKKAGNTLPIYSDSRVAMKWVRDKKTKSTLPPSPKNITLLKIVVRAEKWLQENSYPNQILKWETKAWGEIPADFGRK